MIHLNTNVSKFMTCGNIYSSISRKQNERHWLQFSFNIP